MTAKQAQPTAEPLTRVSLVPREGQSASVWGGAVNAALARLHRDGATIVDVSLSRGSNSQTDIALVVWRRDERGI